MRRPGSAPLRLVTLVMCATVAAQAGAPLSIAAARPPVPAPAVDRAAGGPGAAIRTVRLEGSGERTASTVRPARHVTVRDLPKPRLGAATYEPRLLSPRLATTSTGRAPRVLLGTLPVFAPVGSVNPATEAVSAAGVENPMPGLTEPPDPWIAVGPDHVIQATNTGIRIVDRTAPTASTVKPLFNFFGLDQVAPGYDAETFDPRVIFDSLHSRWIATEASFDCRSDAGNGIAVGTGYIDVAISDSANPTLGWSVISVPYYDTLPDYPGLGTSTDKVVASANVFDLILDPVARLGCDVDAGPTGFAGTELDVMGWAQLVGTAAVDVTYLTSYLGQPDFVNQYLTFRPALQVPATSSTVYVIGDHAAAGSGVTFGTITGLPVSHTVTVTLTDLTSGGPMIGAFNPPPAPRQPSGGPPTIADAVDERPTDALWQNNRLVFVSTYGCTLSGDATGPRACVRVSELNTSTPIPTKRQDFLIAEPGGDHYMGGIGLSGSSNLHVVWTHSSEAANQFPSTRTAYQLLGATNALNGRQQIAAGDGPYPGTRWGDYVGVAQDPQVSDAVWQADEYSTLAATWSTHVSQLRTFGGASYVPITPVRVLDSRPGGVGLGGPFATGVPRSFAVGGVGTIPTGAVAVTGNLTVVGQTAAGFVSVTPNPTATPTSSTINFPLGDIRANNFTLPLGALAKLSAVYKSSAAGKTTHVIVDITGYFVAGSTQATYATITPTRAMDTRPAPNHIGPLGVFHANASQTLQVAGFGGGLIPANATAITGNLTVVGQTKAGYVSVTPNPPSGSPTSSTINFPVGDVRANGLTADLNATGRLSITYVSAAGATANILLDVTGYYLPGPGGLLFYPLNPGRIMDSRPGVVLSGVTGAFATGIPKKLDTDGHWGAPVGAVGITGNLTVVGQTAAGFVADTPTSVPSPAVSTINFPLGDVRANGITVPLGAGNQYLVYRTSTAGKTTHLILDLTGYFR